MPLMEIPKIFIKIRKYAAIASSLGFVGLALRIIHIAISDGRSLITASIIILFCLILAFGLFRQIAWAMRTAALIFVLAAIILPVGVFNPFTAGDNLLAGEGLVSIMSTLLWLVPLEFFLLGVAYALDIRGNDKMKN